MDRLPTSVRLLLLVGGACGVMALVAMSTGAPDGAASGSLRALAIGFAIALAVNVVDMAFGRRAPVPAVSGFAMSGFATSRLAVSGLAVPLVIASSIAGAVLLRALDDLEAGASPGAGFWWLVAAAWLFAWAAVDRLASIDARGRIMKGVLAVAVPLLFGAWLLLLWELVVRGLDVPRVLLPPPSMIAERFASSTDILWADFRQTFLKAVLIGYALGCGAGFAVALLIDRSAFLKRGLMPIGNLVSALPVVGLAPIMVMWFGFDWPSKAAVVIVMTFFPMLVNTVAGLAASSAMQRDLMKTYGASYAQTLFKLRLPQALPFIFNALKINSTLALIGAIVAEFFGTPIVGMGFRISTEVGRMNVDMVWAEIAVAAVAGSSFYGLLALAERAATFWHPSIRGGGPSR